MKKHRLYFTDEVGGFNGTDRQVVCIDQANGVLQIGRQIRIPLREIVATEVRLLPRKPKQKFLAIDVCAPTIENGKPTTIRLIHKNFFLLTKESVMQAVVDELQPLTKGNLKADPAELNAAQPVGEGLLQGQYAFNISLLIGFYRKLWYSYDKPSVIVAKTILLMLLAGVLNILGVLLIAVPFDNFNMSRNLRAVGWSKTATNVTYSVLTFPAYIFWSVYLVKWATK